MLDHTPSSSSQRECHRKLHHQLICPNSSVWTQSLRKRLVLIQVWPREGSVCVCVCVCHPTQMGVGGVAGLIFFFKLIFSPKAILLFPKSQK